MRYAIVCEDVVETFVERVQNMLDGGWRMEGELFQLTDEAGDVYLCRELIREEN